MDIIVNKVAIWRPKLMDELTIHEHPIGTAVLDEETNLFTEVDKPLYRYAKNYTIGKGANALKYCLFVRSFDNDSKGVEKQLDKVAKGITEEQAKGILFKPEYNDFEYLSIKLEEK